MRAVSMAYFWNSFTALSVFSPILYQNWVSMLSKPFLAAQAWVFSVDYTQLLL
jgi:hypothetical protein